MTFITVVSEILWIDDGEWVPSRQTSHRKRPFSELSESGWEGLCRCEYQWSNVLSPLSVYQLCLSPNQSQWCSPCLRRDSAAVKIIGPILWGHSGPLCHALPLSSSLSWTSMRRRRAIVAACHSSDTWWMGVRRLAVANGPNIFQMLLTWWHFAPFLSGVGYWQKL